MDASEVNTTDLSRFRGIFQDYVKENEHKPKSTANIVVMVYKNRWDYKNGKQVLLTEVINGIRTKSERSLVTDKKYLPVAYFPATKMIGRKKNENVVEHSGMIILDIDKDKKPGIDFPSLKQNITADKYTCVCFNSPNGGIKVIVNTNIFALEYHGVYFESIKQHFLKHYNIKEIDPSGCNVARACYLPYDYDCYYNPKPFRYCLDANSIHKIVINIHNDKLLNDQHKSLLQVNSISLDEHYDNMVNLLKKWTEVGLYGNIFNHYRYKNIERGVMSSSVPFLEFIISMNVSPLKLDWTTRLDEIYFKGNTQKPISTDSIEGLDGMEVCEIVLPKGAVIKEGFRGKTLGSISMKLIFNNPFCHIDLIVKEVMRINNEYCEDPHPYNNPMPNYDEVSKIVMENYRRFLCGELNFSKVIRKKHSKNEISKKYVFKSRLHESSDKNAEHLEAIKTYHDGRNAKNKKKFAEAIQVLQDGKRISQKRIAEYLGVSTRTIRRYMTSDYYELVSKYNTSIRQFKKSKPKD
jgi:DNA-binding transcriptional regulator YiaG